MTGRRRVGSIVPVVLRRWWTLLPGILALILAGPASAQDAPPGTARRPAAAIATMADFEAALRERMQMAWTIREASVAAGPDPDGRTIEQYAIESVFNAESEAKLAELRARAESQAGAGDAAGLGETLQEASKLLALSDYRLGVLALHFHLLRTVGVHESALAAVISKAPPGEQRTTRARLDGLARPTSAGLTALLGTVPSADEMQRNPYLGMALVIFRAYNEERQRLAAFAPDWDRREGVTPLSLAREGPCDRAAPAISDSDVPVMDRSAMPSLEYPLEARRFSLEGTVYVRVEVSATGCPERVQVERTTGVDSLDAAALAWVLDARFHPAGKGGEAVAAPVVVAVTFRFTD
jgi:protein TonB